MTIRNQTLQAIASQLAALDLSAENARVAELQEEIDQLDAAIARADQRCMEIGQALGKLSMIDAGSVADALLQGETAMEAATAGPDEAAMRGEQASLRAGIGDLNRRADAARLEMRAVKDRAHRIASEWTKPLADEIAAEMREAAERLVSGFAAAHALQEATRGHGLLALASKRAVDGVMGTDKLLAWRPSEAVPAEIGEVLQTLTGKGAALRVHVPTAAAIG